MKCIGRARKGLPCKKAKRSECSWGVIRLQVILGMDWGCKVRLQEGRELNLVRIHDTQRGWTTCFHAVLQNVEHSTWVFRVKTVQCRTADKRSEQEKRHHRWRTVSSEHWEDGEFNWQRREEQGNEGQGLVERMTRVEKTVDVGYCAVWNRGEKVTWTREQNAQWHTLRIKRQENRSKQDMYRMSNDSVWKRSGERRRPLLVRVALEKDWWAGSVVIMLASLAPVDVSACESSEGERRCRGLVLVKPLKKTFRKGLHFFWTCHRKRHRVHWDGECFRVVHP